MNSCAKTEVPAEILKEQERYTQLAKAKVAEIYYGRTPKYHVHSYGCQANVAEGEKLKGVLAQLGYCFTEDIEQADEKELTPDSKCDSAVIVLLALIVALSIALGGMIYSYVHKYKWDSYYY